MIGKVDGVVSRDPIVVRRHVRWGDCDPAQVVYTPQFAHYAIDAVDAFYDLVVGLRPIAIGDARISFPMKALALEYVSFLVNGDQFDMTVRVGEIRRKTFDMHIEARRGGDVVFRVKASPIAFDTTRGVAIEIPPIQRAVIAHYQQSHLHLSRTTE